MRLVPISHRRSHDPAASKIGLVTPAIYPGLRGVRHGRYQSNMSDVHALPFLAIDQCCVRECSLDEAPKDYAASGAQRTRSEDMVRDVLCELVVTEEYDSLPCDQSVEQDDYRRCERAVGV